MVLLFDTENNKYYRFAGFRPPQIGELYLSNKNHIVRHNKNQSLNAVDFKGSLLCRDILREVEVLYQDKPGQERKYE